MIYLKKLRRTINEHENKIDDTQLRLLVQKQKQKNLSTTMVERRES